MSIVRVCICLYQRKGWKRGGKRGENIKKGGMERKAVPNLGLAAPGLVCFEGGNINGACVCTFSSSLCISSVRVSPPVQNSAALLSSFNFAAPLQW